MNILKCIEFHCVVFFVITKLESKMFSMGPILWVINVSTLIEVLQILKKAVRWSQAHETHTISLSDRFSFHFFFPFNRLLNSPILQFHFHHHQALVSSTKRSFKLKLDIYHAFFSAKKGLNFRNKLGFSNIF